jgi:hypothetical protein
VTWSVVSGTVPGERLRAVFTRNPDISRAALVYQIPLTAVIGQRNTLAPYAEVVAHLHELRRSGASVTIIAGDWGHEAPMRYPSALALVLGHQWRRLERCRPERLRD